MIPHSSLWELFTWLLDKGPGLAVIVGASWAVAKWLGHILKTPIERIDKRITVIEKELQSNGGGSLKDAVKNVERTVSGVKTDVEALTKSQAGQTKKLSLLTKSTAQLKKGQEITRTMITPLIKNLPKSK